MAPNNIDTSVSQTLRPVVIMVIAAKVVVMGFLVASMAGLVPMPDASVQAAPVAAVVKAG
jgi:hypothetical protein